MCQSRRRVRTAASRIANLYVQVVNRSLFGDHPLLGHLELLGSRFQEAPSSRRTKRGSAGSVTSMNLRPGPESAADIPGVAVKREDIKHARTPRPNQLRYERTVR